MIYAPGQHFFMVWRPGSCS